MLFFFCCRCARFIKSMVPCGLGRERTIALKGMQMEIASVRSTIDSSFRVSRWTHGKQRIQTRSDEAYKEPDRVSGRQKKNKNKKEDGVQTIIHLDTTSGSISSSDGGSQAGVETLAFAITYINIYHHSSTFRPPVEPSPYPKTPLANPPS
jgi:hypothetical protein